MLCLLVDVPELVDSRCVVTLGLGNAALAWPAWVNVTPAPLFDKAHLPGAAVATTAHVAEWDGASETEILYVEALAPTCCWRQITPATAVAQMLHCILERMIGQPFLDHPTMFYAEKRLPSADLVQRARNCLFQRLLIVGPTNDTDAFIVLARRK